MAACLLGLIAAIGTGSVIQGKINEQAKILATGYQNKEAALIKEIEAVKTEMQQITGKQSAIIKQQQVLEQRVQTPIVQRPEREMADDSVFSLKTPPGKRAMTIMIDSLSAVGGLVNPGDFVDIIAELDAVDPKGKEKPKKITSVIMQNVQVLAVGTNFQPVGNSLVYQAQQKARSLNVTLALSPEETGLITFTQANGKLQLSLRSPTEQRTQPIQVASWDTLSDYVLARQGTEIKLPSEEADIKETDNKEEVGSFVEVYRGGKEL